MSTRMMLAFVAAIITASEGAIIKVTSDIEGDTTWSSDNEYILTDIIHVRNDATLTIAPGTVVRGEPDSNPNDSTYDPGTLVVTQGARIDAEGTPNDPIIFTTAKLTIDSVVYNDDLIELNYDDLNSPFIDPYPKTSPLFPGEGFLPTAGDTAHTSKENRGLWGGVIILGNAPTNIMNVQGDQLTATSEDSRNDLDGVFKGFIEGLDPDKGKYGVYGGSNPNDNSGTFKYVSIRHGGAKIGGAEINGLTLGGVGFGTLIEYVEVYSCAEDGFEFLGGTVNTRYLISLYNHDDSFDTDEGFTGLGQFWFSLQLDDDKNGDHGGEHDGTNSMFDNADLGKLNGHTINGTGDRGIGIPVSYPTIYNALYVSAGSGDQMLKFADSGGGNYYNSIFVGSAHQLVNANFTTTHDGDEDNDMDDRILAEDCAFVSNSVFYNINGNLGALALSDLSDHTSMQTALAQSNGNLYDGTNPLRSLTNNAVRVNVDPRASSATLGGAVILKPVSATFFITASYLGAFNPTETDYWSDGWSVFSKNVAITLSSRPA